MMTFTCTLFRKSDAVWTESPTYDVEWVRKLRDGLARNYRRPWRMLCLTDGEHELDGVEFVPLLAPDEGWMCNLETFRPDLGIERGAWFGLDTIICGDVTQLFDTAPRISSTRNAGQGQGHRPSNPLMVFDAESAHALWNAWDSDREGWRRRARLEWQPRYPSEQAFFAEVAPALPGWGFLADGTGEVVSYKMELMRWAKLRGTARIVYFHGRTKPPSMPEDDPLWEHWR